MAKNVVSLSWDSIKKIIKKNSITSLHHVKSTCVRIQGSSHVRPERSAGQCSACSASLGLFCVTSGTDAGNQKCSHLLACISTSFGDACERGLGVQCCKTTRARVVQHCIANSSNALGPKSDLSKWAGIPMVHADCCRSRAAISRYTSDRGCS